ncbi:hypothetical protein V5N11_010093 [Cardamine amara subsp. amara]|uniref:NYN domain-containing protein n=1 Tax=Cardamine amara subsp. amara TaxID=228776 RepID=A0ABD1AN62_CARAN
MPALPGDFAAAETSIFWDIEDCEIGELTATEAVNNIKSAISSAGHHGPVSIRAYGDMTGHDFPTEEIKLNHFPTGERYARHTKILEDIISWAAQQPLPSNLMLIIGDTSGDFVEIVELLKSRKNYRFLLVHP